jgi:hypothetical protein
MSKPQTYYSALSAGMARDRLAAENERLRGERDQLRAALDTMRNIDPWVNEEGSLLCVACGEEQEHAHDCPFLAADAVLAGSFSEPEREHQ